MGFFAGVTCLFVWENLRWLHSAVGYFWHNITSLVKTKQKLRHISK